MKKIKLFAVCLIAIMALASCSMQKRLYNKGYYVSWKKSKPQQSTQKVVVSNENYSDIPMKSAYIQADHLPQNEVKMNLTTSVNQKLPALIKNRNNKVVISYPKTTFYQYLKTKLSNTINISDARRMHPKATAALVLGILSLVIYYGAFIVGALAIIFGAIALKEMRKNPEMYSGKQRAKAGLICGIIAISLILLVILLI